MNILALDTATEACSAALLAGTAVHERHAIAPRRHAALILPMVDAVLTEAGLALNNLDAIAFGRGPGAFTGVRIAAGVTQGLACGAGLPVLPVSSLAALAQGALDNSAGNGFALAHTASETATRLKTPARGALALAAIDARMGEIYWALYEAGADGLVKPLGDEQVSAPEAPDVAGEEKIVGVGSGWGTYRAPLERILPGRIAGIDPERFPLAKHILPLAVKAYQAGHTIDAAQALPVYLRDNVVR